MDGCLILWIFYFFYLFLAFLASPLDSSASLTIYQGVKHEFVFKLRNNCFGFVNLSVNCVIKA